MEIVIHNLKQGLIISIFVFAIMMLTDYINVLTMGRITHLIKGSKLRQYIVASLLGTFPGCLGAFMVVSFYIRGAISLGALVGCMIATTGDESFLMLSLFPKKAVFLHFILFLIGVGSAFIMDKLVKYFKLKEPYKCEQELLHKEDEEYTLDFKRILNFFKKISFTRFLLISLLIFFLYVIFIPGSELLDSGWERITFVSLLFLSLFIVVSAQEHYLEKHIWEHILKTHIRRVFLWSFFAFLFVDIGLKSFNIEKIINSKLIYVIFISSLVGIIPESGPHLVFVTMFYKGVIPFSVLLVSSLVQDGHALIPLLSHSVKISIWVKIFNLIIGLIIGYTLYCLKL